MSTVSFKRVAKAQRAATVDAGTVVGLVESISTDGIVMVDYPGNTAGPVAARLVGNSEQLGIVTGAQVALLIEPGNASSPMLLGAITDRLRRPVRPSVASALIDGERVILEGRKEVVLRCGRGSITLTADGKIVLKGTELVSRSSGTHKIRGAVVSIN